MRAILLEQRAGRKPPVREQQPFYASGLEFRRNTDRRVHVLDVSLS